MVSIFIRLLFNKITIVPGFCAAYLSIFLCGAVTAQITHDRIWNNYSLAQKRLLVTATAQFLYTVSQGQLDKDSSVLYSCSIYGVGRLFPYKDGFVKEWTSPGTQLIETGNIDQATQLLGKLKAVEKIKLLLELGIYYLYKTGATTPDLYSAYFFTGQAIQLSSTLGIEWQLESKSLLGKIYFQENKLDQAKDVFSEILKDCQRTKDESNMAIAYENLGKHLPYGDPMKLKNLELSFDSYEALKMKEKQLDVLSEIVVIYFMSDWAMAEKKLYQVLELMKQDGYEHTLFTQYVLSYLADAKGNFIEALSYINEAMVNMNYTGDTVFSALFYTIEGDVHSVMGNQDSSVYWHKMAMAARYRQPPLFWYKSFFAVVPSLIDLGRKEEALELTIEIPKEFPPVTMFDSMHLAYIVGLCYANLNNMKLAEKNYSIFLNFADHFPPEFTYTEMPDAYSNIAWFYFNKSDYMKSRLYLQKTFTVVKGRTGVFILAKSYGLLFKLDSAAGDFRAAMEDHVKYKFYADSNAHISQRLQMDELTMKYGAEKKDQDIRFLKQQGIAQQSELKQSALVRNIFVAGVILLIIIMSLLLNQYRLKQRTNNAINKKNDALNKLVNEKEWLLKEVHHRVKNNLQTVVSLLELQSENLKDEALSAIHESQNRIYAMSLIHQKLYQTDKIASINMQPYLRELSNHLQSFYNPERKINFDMQVAPIELDVSQAIPVGLIVNEAVTNSIKYAFNQSVSFPEVSIILVQNKKQDLKLIIADNGTGLPFSFNTNDTSGLGFKLMKALAEDIEGKLTIELKEGTVIKVIFNASITFDEKSEIPEPEKTYAI
ncbi:MAG: sensor histidine kinase [Ginsengibacter sp.]